MEPTHSSQVKRSHRLHRKPHKTSVQLMQSQHYRYSDPLIGMDKEEIVNEAKRLGTYKLSIQPHDDCCSFLTPRHPVTKSTVLELDAVEKELDIDALVAMSLADVKEIRIA